MTLRDHFRLIHRDLFATFHDFAWGTRQTRQALKTGSACVAAVLLTYLLDLKEAYWAGITTMIMMRPNVAASIQKGWMRAGGACCGCFLAVVLTGLFLQQHLTYTIAFFSLSVLGLYLGATARNGYFWSYFVMNGVLISMVGMTQPDITVYITVHRGAAITIGVLVSLVVNVVLFPDYAHETLKADFEQQRAKAFEWIQEIVRQYMKSDYHGETVEGGYRELLKGLRHIRKLLQDAAFEMKLFKGDPHIVKALLNRLSHRIEDFYGLYQELSRQTSAEAYQENHRFALQDLLGKLERLTEAEGWSLSENDPSTENVRSVLSRLESDYEKPPAEGRREDYEVIDYLRFLELVFLLKRIVDDLTFKTREDTVNDVAAIGEEPDSGEHSDLYRFVFLGRTHALHVPTLKYAIKGALGIVSVFWFWLWAEIPGGALNMSVAVITVLQQDLMSTIHKGLLRFTGCLVGALTGYAFLGFQVESTLVLAISIFGVVSLFAYIWGGRPGCAYLGCQAGLCYILATVHDLAAMTSLAPPTERLTGIFLGVLFTWTINLLVWREDLLATFSMSIRTAQKNLVAAGEALGARFNGSRGGASKVSDIIALESTLQTLLTQGEMSSADAAPVRAWLDQMRLLTKESVGMEPVDEQTAGILSTLDPDFIPKLIETVFLMSRVRSQEDFTRIRLRLERQQRAFDGFVARLRQGPADVSIADKQRVAHAIMVLKRLIYRLDALSEAGRRFHGFIANDRDVHGTAVSVSH